jgi:hypothetical protein
MEHDLNIVRIIEADYDIEIDETVDPIGFCVACLSSAQPHMSNTIGVALYTKKGKTMPVRTSFCEEHAHYFGVIMLNDYDILERLRKWSGQSNTNS